MKRFLLRLLGWALTPLALLCALFFAVLLRSGELQNPADVAARSAAGQTSLVEPLYFGGGFQNWYKAQVAWARGAQVLVLGTSRSMQIRSCMLPGAGSFYNGAGGITRLEEVPDYLSRFEEEKLPRLLILGLDQYFFNAAWSGATGQVEWNYAPQPMDFGSMLADAARRWGMGGYRIGAVFAAPSGSVGLPACSRNRGFSADGSYHYGQDAEAQAIDFTFDDCRRRIDVGGSRFEYADTVKQAALNRLDEVLDFCDENDIQVIGFLPPYAPSVGQWMRQDGRYGYLEKLPAAVQAVFARHPSGLAVYDFTFMEGVCDEQFVDGFHGGDVVYAEMLRRMAGDGGPLAALTDDAALRALIEGAKNPRVIEPPAA